MQSNPRISVNVLVISVKILVKRTLTGAMGGLPSAQLQGFGSGEYTRERLVRSQKNQ